MIFCIISLCILSTWEGLSSFKRESLHYVIQSLNRILFTILPAGHLSLSLVAARPESWRKCCQDMQWQPELLILWNTKGETLVPLWGLVAPGGWQGRGTPCGALSEQGMPANAHPTAPALGTSLDPWVGWAGLWEVGSSPAAASGSVWIEGCSRTHRDHSLYLKHPMKHNCHGFSVSKHPVLHCDGLCSVRAVGLRLEA